MTILRGLPPVFNGQARVLILGSFPSEASLAAQQYYAYRHNQFWPLLGALIGQPLPALDYAARIQTVRSAGIAIWDVLASCERVGSLDSAIRNGQPNDFGLLMRQAPRLKRICFNGKAAGRFASLLQGFGYDVVVLPSTSPANATWSFERKLDAWRTAINLP